MAGKKIHYVDSDILVIGGGFGGCGAAYESRYWGRDKKIVVVEKGPGLQKLRKKYPHIKISSIVRLEMDEGKVVLLDEVI